MEYNKENIVKQLGEEWTSKASNYKSLDHRDQLLFSIFNLSASCKWMHNSHRKQAFLHFANDTLRKYRVPLNEGLHASEYDDFVFL